jgi:hypothetical protein
MRATVVTWSLLLAVGSVGAQSAPRESVMLRIHPRAGDTLRTRLDQQTEVSVPKRAGSAASATLITSVTVLARTIVQASRATTTTVLTVVDSASVRSSDPRGSQMVEAAERSLRGQQLVLHLAEDGSVESAKDARGVAVPRDVAEAMAAMPAVFPHRAVSVGEKWQREMPLPAAGPVGSRGSAHVLSEFRLDSLGRGGEIAYVSLRGEIIPDGGRQGVQLTGTITGAMQVDRTRGWMTDSRFTVLMKSIVSAPAAGATMPLQFLTKVTQRLRTMDKR